eukprot:TRINITY_DN16459_c0_g1_i1.p2 TRINITY_DN16459_c0_g1~~TRINITY_DN16459_c0_g1_i1.p2  ORF type:complete len:261 (-),score=48.05 TRINITY_DN16459_c0_g1_i1:199-981(-)
MARIARAAVFTAVLLAIFLRGSRDGDFVQGRRGSEAARRALRGGGPRGEEPKRPELPKEGAQDGSTPAHHENWFSSMVLSVFLCIPLGVLATIAEAPRNAAWACNPAVEQVFAANAAAPTSAADIEKLRAGGWESFSDKQDQLIAGDERSEWAQRKRTERAARRASRPFQEMRVPMCPADVGADKLGAVFAPVYEAMPGLPRVEPALVGSNPVFGDVLVRLYLFYKFGCQPGDDDEQEQGQNDKNDTSRPRQDHGMGREA